MNEHKELLTKWLKILMYVHIANIALSVISMFPVNDGWSRWAGIATSAMVTAAMYAMAPVSRRYKTAGNFYAVYLVCTVLNQTALALVASILSLIAMYQEYSAHSELVAQADPNLSANWHSLFNWKIIVSILTSVVSMVATMVLVVMELSTNTIVTVIVGFMLAVSIVLDVIYIRLMRKILDLLETEI